MMKRISSEELSMMKEDCRISGAELKEMATCCRLHNQNRAQWKKLVSDWKEECRRLVHKGLAKEDHYEAEMTTMQSELLSKSQAWLASRVRNTTNTNEAMSSKCQAMEMKEMS